MREKTGKNFAANEDVILRSVGELSLNPELLISMEEKQSLMTDFL